MLESGKSVVYRSRDKSDWMYARSLLKEEIPVGGCGAKIQPGNFWGRSRGSIFSIEVASELKQQAERILQGKVLPVKECGMRL